MNDNDINNDGEQTRSFVILNKGTEVLHYRIIDKIGAGGMGVVYLAEDTKLKRNVALKFLPTSLMANNEIRTRFIREAQTVAKLNHPNIVSIYEVSELEGRPFYAMELVEGETLHYYCHEKQLPNDSLIDYAIQICQGLGEAHRAGIIHRDIKSANIAVDNNGRIRLLDFGLAAKDGDDKITKTGSTLGTVSYMSPEQVSGRDIDHRADLFALGVVLYELIAGQTPFKRDSEGATLNAIIEDNPEPLLRYKADVPERLQEIISKLLEKDKELRYQSAEGVIADLKRMMYDSQQTGYTRTIQAKPKKKRMMIGLAGIVVFCIASIAYFMSQPDKSAIVDDDKVPRIAVLPFENLGSPDDEYFADGMTDEIISRLVLIDGLGVISRTSSMKYKSTDKNLKQIGSELNVEYILGGTVRWSIVNDQVKVKITPKLIKVSNDRNLWAGNYERELMEVFAVQADIAEKIVEQLGITLVASDKANLNIRPTENAEAYRLYLRAMNIIRRNDYTEDNPLIIIDSAVALDPSFALAHALRSEIYSLRSFGSPSSKFATIAIESAKKALELQPGIPSGHLALGKYYNNVETDYERALEEFSMARSEMHSNSDLLEAIAYVQMRQGKFIEGLDNQRRAVELDPINPARHEYLANLLNFNRKYDEALESINRAISLEPDKAWHYRLKTEILLSKYGDLEKIKPIAQEALKKCDTIIFTMSYMGIKNLTPELPWDEWLNDLQQMTAARFESDSAIYTTMMIMASEINNSGMLKQYADSIYKYFQDTYNDQPENPYYNSYLGLVLTYLGNYDRAVELGRRGKELLSVKECHY